MKTQEPPTPSSYGGRPLNVIQACLLQLFSAFLTAVTTFDGYDYYVEMGMLLGQTTGSFQQFLASRGLSVVVTLALAWFFYQRKNWARIVYVVFFAFNTILMMWGIGIAGNVFLDHLWEVDTLVSILQVLIALVVSCLLWTSQSSSWFRQKSPEHETTSR